MEAYILNLPNNVTATVINRKEFNNIQPSPLQPFASLFRKKRIGYIVKVDNKSEYRVFKTKKGGWISIGDDELKLNIKRAIDQYEFKKGENFYK